MSDSWRVDGGEGLWPRGVGRRIMLETDSTNAEGLRLAATLDGPEWIVARLQTAGRGRRGKTWESPHGNFAGTLVMRPTEPADQVALRSFVAALALYDTLVAILGRTEGLELKWPNDVLLDGGKVAGILLESEGSGSKINHLAIGIGVNLASAPDPDTLEDDAVPPVALGDVMGGTIGPDNFLELLGPAYAYWENQFTTHGFAPVRAAWLDRAARLGELITARTGKTELVGTFETVDETGNLILTNAEGRHAIPAAQVFF